MTRNRVEVMHGVNLDQLGRRDPQHYGRVTLTELELRVKQFAHELGLGEREQWRRHSVIRELCIGVVEGQGVDGYREALELLQSALEDRA